MSLDDFNQAFKDNPDGCGFAWFENDAVRFKKGLMMPQEAWDFMKTLELPFTVHFRKQSVGIVTPLLTHPFIISKESPLELEGETEAVLFHNGSHYVWEDYLNAAGIYKKKGELISDSRAIAMIISKDGMVDDEPSHRNYDFLRILKSKFVLADKEKNTFIYYPGDGFIELNGVYYSNLSWKNSVKKKKSKNYSNSTTTTTNGANICNHPWQNAEISFRVLNVPFEETSVLRYMLNKMSRKASQKLWNKLCRKKTTIEKAEIAGLKTIKQQKVGNFDGLEKFLLKRKKFRESLEKKPDDTSGVIIIDKH